MTNKSAQSYLQTVIDREIGRLTNEINDYKIHIEQLTDHIKLETNNMHELEKKLQQLNNG